jgi:hypothetical protein
LPALYNRPSTIGHITPCISSSTSGWFDHVHTVFGIALLIKRKTVNWLGLLVNSFYFLTAFL